MMGPTRGRRPTLLAIALAMAACQPGPSAAPGSSAPAQASPSAAASSGTPTPAPPTIAVTAPAARELPAPNTLLPGGRYTLGAFAPRITFEVTNLQWTAGPRSDRLFGVFGRGSTAGSRIALRFARPSAIHAGPDSIVDATTAAAAIETLVSNPAVVHLVTDESRMDGISGTVIELEAAPDGQTYGVLRAGPGGAIEVGPGRRLWAAFFDTPRGLLAIVVEGSGGAWEADLGAVEAVLESTTIGR